MTSSLAADRVGQLVLRPGNSLDAIGNTRTVLAQRLLGGKAATSAPPQLARLYALCGCAHSLTAQLAIDAANGVRSTASVAEQVSLALETAREHVRRIWLDWPRLLSATVSAQLVLVLRDCPLFRPGLTSSELPADLLRWTESSVLGEPADRWLARWQDDPLQCLRHWTASAATMPAALLATVAATASDLEPLAAPLLPHRDVAAMQALAHDIAGDADFGRYPTHAGTICETGVWTRLAYRSASPQGNGVWLRLGARIAELARLSRGDAVLSVGAMALGNGAALAWSEMARGLLLHRVQLSGTAQQGEQTIVDYRIVAPTEWNFHPQGVVAQALAAMPAVRSDAEREHTSRQVALLVAAFDPCVDYRIEFEHA